VIVATAYWHSNDCYFHNNDETYVVTKDNYYPEIDITRKTYNSFFFFISISISLESTDGRNTSIQEI